MCRGKGNVSAAVLNHCDLRVSVQCACVCVCLCGCTPYAKEDEGVSLARPSRFLIMMMLMISGRFIFLLHTFSVSLNLSPQLFSFFFVDVARANQKIVLSRACARAFLSLFHAVCVPVCDMVVRSILCCCFFVFLLLWFGFFNVLGLGCRLLLFLVWRTADSLGMLWLAFASKESSPSSGLWSVGIDCN